MIYSTKAEFMSALTDRFRQMSLPADEIIEDIEQHFSEGKESGLTEQEICEKLGSPEEIAEAYIQDNGYEIPKPDINTVNNGGDITANCETAPKASAGGIIAALCLDIFVYSWTLPTLLALVIAYIAVAFALVVAGAVNMVTSFIPGVSESLTNLMFGSLFGLFSGMTALGLGGIMSVFVTNIVKGYIGIIKSIARFHVKAFTGRKAGF